ncbi:MAG: YkgJ family cysteine cluster protein [Bacteroidales bacterium]|nr:YkgJ family cysteine cluster protein [Bacteroidales bacterium]
MKKIEQLGKKRESENFKFRSFLKGQDSEKIDRIVHALNKYYSSKIDCAECGNCCIALQALINKNDLEKLTLGLKISDSELKKKYTEVDEDGDLYFKHKPCRFLKDKKCEIYNFRPEDCESYPHLHKEHFIGRLFGVIDNYSICPIVFNVYEDLKIELKFK